MYYFAKRVNNDNRGDFHEILKKKISGQRGGMASDITKYSKSKA